MYGCGGLRKQLVRCFAQLLCVVLLAFWCTGAEGQGWHLTRASYRATIEKHRNSPWPADAGYVLVWPAGFDPANCHVSVFSASGLPVGSQILWAEKGEALKVLFDTSSAESMYYVYVGDRRSTSAPPWNVEAGLILETRKLIPGEPDSLARIKQMWEESGSSLGRSVGDRIFHGIHPHGPTKNFISHYVGYFNASQDGDYLFVTVSDDASFLLVDDRLVAEWPGFHDAGGGRRGEHSGRIRLAKGRHAIEYYHAQKDRSSAAVAAWRPPMMDHLEVMGAEDFVSLARFRTISYDSSSTEPSKACFEWQVMTHTLVGGIAIVTVRFRAFPRRAGLTYRWIFDDGCGAEKRVVDHVFPRCGFREVTLGIFEDGCQLGGLSERILVHRDWSRREEWPVATFKEQKSDLMNREWGVTPVEDIANVAAWANNINDHDLLTRLGAACFAREREFAPKHTAVFLKLGFHYLHHDVRQYEMAERAFRTVLLLEPGDTVLSEKTRLHLAELLVNCSDKPEEAQVLLDQVGAQHLTKEDKRRRKIVLADAFLALGHIERARRHCLEAGDIGKRTDRLYAAKRRTRLELARNFVTRCKYDAAARLIGRIEWETPTEKLSPETGLLMIDVFKGRGEYPRALARCRALDHVLVSDPHRAFLLYKLAGIRLAMGRPNEAEETLATLSEQYPYSEAAAMAVDKMQ